MKKISILILSILIISLLDQFLFNKIYNKNNYLNGYEKFYKKLIETKGNKRIILLGGSSLAWGVSAKKITDDLKILTLNSGLHANIGYKNSFKIVSKYIDKKKDIIVISPEYILTKGRSKENCYILNVVLKKIDIFCIGSNLSRVMLKPQLLIDNNNDYFMGGFNEFGDYEFRKNQNLNMKNKVNFNSVCKNINLDELIHNYIPFYKKLKKENFKIIYIPNLIPKSSCINQIKLSKFHNALQNEFGVNDVKNFKLILDDEFFYDTNYHLTKKGIDIKTNQFLNFLNKIIAK